jgi:hypothetical protein
VRAALAFRKDDEVTLRKKIVAAVTPRLEDLSRAAVEAKRCVLEGSTATLRLLRIGDRLEGEGGQVSNAHVRWRAETEASVVGLGGGAMRLTFKSRLDDFSNQVIADVTDAAIGAAAMEGAFKTRLFDAAMDELAAELMVRSEAKRMEEEEVEGLKASIRREVAAALQEEFSKRSEAIRSEAKREVRDRLLEVLDECASR